MPSRIRTENKRWEVTGKPFPGDAESERGVIVTIISKGAQPRTAAIVAAVMDLSGAEISQRVPSRLVELEREGYIRSSFDADLFS